MYNHLIIFLLILSFSPLIGQNFFRNDEESFDDFEEEPLQEEEYNEDEYSEDTYYFESNSDNQFQNEFKFFSDAISENIRLYKANSRFANEKGDKERNQYLFDSLVNHCLKGSHFDNFLVTKSNGSLMYFEDFEKPIYLKSTATWCEPNDSESAAFNDVAKEFSDLIDFVVLYWDSRDNLDSINQKYSSHVTILYVDEIGNYNSDIVATLKHSLGLPTFILMDSERTVIDVKRGANPIYEPSFEEGIKPYGTYNPEATKEHFVNSYSNYFDNLVLDINQIISKTSSSQN